MKEKQINARTITWYAILLALIVVLQAFSGYMRIGTVEFNLTLVPVVLGALVLGPMCAAILGFISGAITLLFGVFGLAPLTYGMFIYSPVLTSAICLLKCTVAGYVGGLLYKIISKKNKHVATFLTAGIVPIINTTLFVIGACFFKAVFVEMNLATSADVILVVILSMIIVNFLVELAINLVLAPAICRVTEVISKYRR